MESTALAYDDNWTTKKETPQKRKLKILSKSKELKTSTVEIRRCVEDHLMKKQYRTEEDYYGI